MKLSFVAEECDNGRNVIMELHIADGTLHTEITEHYIDFLRAIGYVIDHDTQDRVIDSF